jgi:hypothetical protein
MRRYTFAEVMGLGGHKISPPEASRRILYFKSLYGLVQHRASSAHDLADHRAGSGAAWSGIP